MSIYKNLSDAVGPEIALGAAQPKQQAEPFSPEAINTTQTSWKMGYEAAKAEQQQAEPVAWVLEWIENGEQKHHRLYDDKQKCFRDAESDGGVCRPLVYCDTPPQRKQLTEWQAQDIVEAESWGPDAITLNFQLLRTIRRTEAAHGIKEPKS